MNYFEERDLKANFIIERVLLDLPPFCRMFFYAKDLNMAKSTLRAYSYFLRKFFRFVCVGKSISNFSLLDLENTRQEHIQDFIKELSETTCEDYVANAIYKLNTFFAYYTKSGEITHNPVTIDAPQYKEKPVIKLTKEETQMVLAAVNNDTRKLNNMKKLTDLELLRDKTILILFLSTGIRVAELVGLNYGDIDLNNASFIVQRKGGNKDTIYMTSELIKQLKLYFKHFTKTNADEPVFTTKFKGRMLTQSMQALVKKYCKLADIKKKITPHKLRATFGTSIYEKTRDIYLVASLLGHADVKTTVRHYTTVKEDIKRAALNGFKII